MILHRWLLSIQSGESLIDSTKIFKKLKNLFSSTKDSLFCYDLVEFNKYFCWHKILLIKPNFIWYWQTAWFIAQNNLVRLTIFFSWCTLTEILNNSTNYLVIANTFFADSIFCIFLFFHFIKQIFLDKSTFSIIN